jgi:uncharacterized protein
LGEVKLAGRHGAAAALLLRIVTFGVGGETGWRGFALTQLQRRHSVATAPVLVALVWAAWHAPHWLYLPAYQEPG